LLLLLLLLLLRCDVDEQAPPAMAAERLSSSDGKITSNALPSS